MSSLVARLSGGGGSSTSNQQQQQQQQQQNSTNSGGMLSGVASTLDGAYQGAAGVADDLAGSTDETVARQFDNEEGGGFADGLKSFTGATAWRQSEQGQELSEEYQNVEEQGDGVLSGLAADAKRFDVATQAGFDYLLDNPNASVQDTIRGGLQGLTGEKDKEEFAEGLQQSATNFSETTSGLLEDTPLDNGATDVTVGAFDALVADPIKAGVTATTGVDIDQGTSEGNVGAVDALDLGLTIGTAGAGKAALSGSRGAFGLGDEVASLADEATGAISRWGSTDEVASVADDAAEGVTDLPALADDAADSATTGRFGEFLGSTGRTADDAAGAADDAAGAADDAADSATTGRFGEFLGSTGRTADDAATAAVDGAGSAVTRIRDTFARIGDEFGSIADDTAEATAKSSDDADGLLSGNLLTRRNAGIATAGFLAGGAATSLSGADDPRQAPDEITTEAGKDLTAVKTYKPVEQFPNGGKLFAVTQNYQNIGYWLLLGVQGRTLYVLDSNGEPRQARINAEQFSNMMSTNEGGGA